MESLFTLWQTRQEALLKALFEHLWLSLISLGLAVIIAVPLAILLSNRKRLAEFVLQLTSILQTIPSLALLGLLIPLVGIGVVPAIIALTLYALLPIFQNTYLGLSKIDPAIKEAETAFGLSRWQQLKRIELPMALPAIISGVRTSSVFIIGTATLAALIGAGGLGSIILLGIDRHNMQLTLIGAILAALLAVIVSGFIYWLQHSKHKKALIAFGMAIIAAVSIPRWINHTPVKTTVTIAGKLGSEPEILINMYKFLIEESDPSIEVVIKPHFGKTTFLFNALTSGDIDIYPEFTGTVVESLVQLPESEKGKIRSAEETYELGKSLVKSQFNLAYLPPMKYQNTYAMAVLADYAKAHDLSKISDLAKVKSQIRAGFTLEFMDRDDGYKGLSQQHHISFNNVTSMDASLRYSALTADKIDLIDAYSTDSEIKQYKMKMLEDDLHLFPAYQGAPLMKADFAHQYPQIVQALNQLAGKISETEMTEMNYLVKVKGENPAQVAKDYLQRMALIAP